MRSSDSNGHPPRADALEQAIAALRLQDGNAAEVNQLSRALAAELARPTSAPVKPVTGPTFPLLGARGLSLIGLSLGLGLWTMSAYLTGESAEPATPEQAPVEAPHAVLQEIQPEPAPNDDAPPAEAPAPSTETSKPPQATHESAAPRRRRAVPRVGSAPDELTLLSRAQAALTSRPSEALSLTAEHRARFSLGVFAQEREIIAIEAELKLGRRDAAQRRATRFVDSFPYSTHETRVRRLLREIATGAEGSSNNPSAESTPTKQVEHIDPQPREE